MKTQEIRNLSIEELKDRIAEETAKLEQLKFNHSISPLDNPMSIKATRRNVARLKTVLTQKSLDTTL